MLDSHCHLADDVFVPDLDEVIARAQSAGVSRALCIVDAVADEELTRARVLQAKWPGVERAVGVHPHQAGVFEARPGAAAEAVASRLAGAVAVGEIGLDYHYDFAPRAVQLAVFEAQLALAKREDLPVVIHCREAEDDVVAAIERAGAPRGIFHCFTGDERFARRVVSLGFHVSFSGIVTFPKAESLRAAARIVPLERLLIETDSPFLAPVPHRGQRNEPAWVGHVAECIARLRGVSLAELLTQVHRNFDALCARSRPAATHGPE